MTTHADMMRIYGDPDDDYNTLEKCVVRSIDALDAVAAHLDDYIFEANNGLIGDGTIDHKFIKNLRSQKAVCVSLRNSLREWSLGIPDHEVAKP